MKNNINENNTFSELQVDIHQNAIDHGWWDNPKSFGEIIALIHSECSEALEEHRNGKLPNETYYSGDKVICSVEDRPIILRATSKDKNAIRIPGSIKDDNLSKIRIFIDKPEGIPSELADIVIRVMDYCEWAGIDLEAAIREKHEYNKSRPYKHGGKKI